MDSGVKNVFNRFSVKQIVCSLMAILSLLLFFILTIWSSKKIKALDSQQAATRWDEEGGSAQVSCFFSEEVTVDEMQLTGFKLELEKSLKEVLSAEEYSNEYGRRLIIDAYSSMGKITLTSDKGSLEADAVGIGGDFFFFHPLKLVSGGYFSGEDLMKDSIIIDEEAAWQLFGSSDIAGQCVLIDHVPHFVEGVIKREEGKLAKRAGLDKSIVYVSNETLNAYGTGKGISTYEVVAPNPVKGYVYNKVKEKIGVKEDDMIVVENSSRYSAEALIPVILDFGMRSMQHTAVRFPYWENMARGFEDMRALVLLFQFILLLIPIVIMISFLVIKWKQRTFSWKDIGNKVIDFKERSIQYLRRKKDHDKGQ